MTEVFWFEQTEADLPAHDDWLSATERVRLQNFRIPKRRGEWRLGRWTAKRAAAVYLELPSHADSLARIEIRPEISGAPALFVDNERATASISISHRDDTSVCCLSELSSKVGCDLERVEARSDSFAADFFTAEEYATVCAASPADRTRLVTLIWSAKESALKVLQEGLRLDTRSVEVVSLDPLHSCTVDHWHPLLVECEGSPTFHGWWQFGGEFVRTVVAYPAPLAPVALAAGNIPSRLVA